MGNEVILAVDQGTTGTTCLLVNSDLAIVGQSTAGFPQHYPQPGRVEHHPSEIWDSVVTAIGQVLATSNVSPQRICAIGITNQRETSLIWQRNNGEPIHPAIVWQDRRTTDICKKLKADGIEPNISTKTGLLLDPYFSATKLAWILDHVEGARQQVDANQLAAGTVDTFLLWKLTDGQVHSTEPTNACRTLLWPLEGSDWSDSLCNQFRVPRSILPEVHPCNHTFGHTQKVPGLPDGIPICGIIGDQQSALFAQTCFESGEAKCTYGTGAFAVLNTGPRPVHSRNRLLSSVAWRINDDTTYCLEGSAFMAGAVVEWLIKGLGIISSPTDVEPLAQSVRSSDGVVLVPAHAGMGAPHWKPDARGIITGLSRGTTKAHIARAALEGIALETADLFEAMKGDMGQPIVDIKVDGGAATNNLLMQTQADILNLPIARSTHLESTGLGAAFMAGIGAGIWPNTKTLTQKWKKEHLFTPTSDRTYVKTLMSNWNRALRHLV